MEYIGTVGEIPGCEVEAGGLTTAAGHLNTALELLVGINDKLIDGLINFMDFIEELSTVWNEINKCRIYTQGSVYFEDLLIPAMGFVNDAKLMLESLVHWNLGMTLYGKISILSSIREAITGGIGPGINRLELCMAPL